MLVETRDVKNKKDIGAALPNCTYSYVHICKRAISGCKYFLLENKI